MSSKSLKLLLVEAFADHHFDFPAIDEDAWALATWLHEQGKTYRSMAHFAGLSEGAFSHWRRNASKRPQEREMIQEAFNRPYAEFIQSPQGQKWQERCCLGSFLHENETESKALLDLT